VKGILGFMTLPSETPAAAKEAKEAARGSSSVLLRAENKLRFARNSVVSESRLASCSNKLVVVSTVSFNKLMA